MSEEKVKVAPVTKIAVAMKDGTTVHFNQKQRIVTDTVFNDEGFTQTFSCKNGDKHTLTVNKDSTLFIPLAAHGGKQKVSDAAVKAESDEDVSISIERAISQINKGVWVERSGDGVARGIADVIEAVRRTKNYEIGSEQAKASAESIKAMADDTIKTLRNNMTVKGHLLAIAQERAAAAQQKALAGQSTNDLDALDALGV